MFVTSIQEYGQQDYQNPMLLRRDPIFVTQIVVLIALAMILTIISFLYSRYCSYPKLACSLSSNSSRQKLRRYAQLGGLVVLEKTTRDNNTKSPIDEEGGGVITTGHSPIGEHHSSYIKGSSHNGQGLGQGLGQGQESWDPALSIVSSDTERNLAAVVKDAVEAVKDGDEETYQSKRKLSLNARRNAFLEFLAKTEYHQTSPAEEHVGDEEEEDDDDNDDTVIVPPRHYSFGRGIEALGSTIVGNRHHSTT